MPAGSLTNKAFVGQSVVQKNSSYAKNSVTLLAWICLGWPTSLWVYLQTTREEEAAREGGHTRCPTRRRTPKCRLCAYDAHDTLLLAAGLIARVRIISRIKVNGREAATPDQVYSAAFAPLPGHLPRAARNTMKADRRRDAALCRARNNRSHRVLANFGCNGPLFFGMYAEPAGCEPLFLPLHRR